jgi:drug/metabolite transporter (DMT)-like permease
MNTLKTRPALFWIIGFPFAALWASASVASKIGLTAAQPFTISFIRFTAAGLLMLLISHVFMQKQLPKGKQWKQLAIYGLLNISLYLGLFIIAIGEVSAGLGSLAVAINPVIITVALAIWDRQKLALIKVASLLIGIIGVSVCSFPLIVASHASVKGLIILFLSMSVYSIGTIYFQKNKWDGLHLLTINGWQTLFGALFTLPALLLTWESHKNNFDISFWGATLWLVFMVSIAAVQSWIFLLRNFGDRSSYWLFLSPIFGFMFSNLIMHEPISSHTFLGTVLVLSSLYINTREKLKTTKN